MKRRLLAILLATILVVSLVPGMAFAATGPVLTVGNATVDTEGTGSVSVTISGNTGFDNVTFYIEVGEGITVNSVSTENTLISDWTYLYNSEIGHFSAYTIGEAVTEDGVICTINFTALPAFTSIPSASSSSFRFTEISPLASASAVKLIVQITPSSVTASPIVYALK